jgi:FkbM family methyltransferase
MEAADDPLWETRRVALGEADGEATLHVGSKHATSSLLEVSENHLNALPASIQEKDETVPLARLEHTPIEFGSRCLLKLDVQGAELQVISGASALLNRLALVECELSVVSLYDQQPLMTDVLGFLREHRFELIALEPGFYDPATGEHLQFDGIFCRNGVKPIR